MILFNLDTEDANDRSKLREQIRTASLAELKQAGIAADQDMAGILMSRPLTHFESLALQMLDLQIKTLQDAQAGTSTGLAVTEAPLPPDTAAGWEELMVYAARLPRQGAGRRPHTPLTHLKQRLGDSQRGKRPPVRARSGGGATIVTVDGTNFDRLLDTAQNRRWRLLTRSEVEKFRDYLEEKNSPKYSGEGKEEKDSAGAKSPEGQKDSSGLWSKVLVFSGDANDKGKPDDDQKREKVFKEAWGVITSMVEDEVLEAIGLPDVRIYTSYPAEIFGDRPCFYDEGGAQDRVRVGVPDYPYGASYYADAGTELLAYSVEWNVLLSLDTFYGLWSPAARDQPSTVLATCDCGPEFALLLLHALRPGEMRAAGFAYPALL